MYRYEAQYVKNFDEFLKVRDTLPKAAVDKYPWNCGFQPCTYAQMAWNEDGLFIYMRAYETDPRMTEEADNGDIYMDSCLEFFVNPCPDAVFFCNFEVNPKGFMYLASGPENLDDRTLEDRSAFDNFDLTASVQAEYWDVCYRVPTAYFRKFNPNFSLDAEKILQANFYKCGDGTPIPHYGCWSPITSGEETPNFYHVCDFGEIVLK